MREDSNTSPRSDAAVAGPQHAKASRAGAVARPTPKARSRVRLTLFALIAVLYVFSVPWYRTSGDPLHLLFGLPDWVFVALCCYVAVAILNSIAWLLTDVSDGPAAEEESGSRRSSEKGTTR